MLKMSWVIVAYICLSFGNLSLYAETDMHKVAAIQQSKFTSIESQLAALKAEMTAIKTTNDLLKSEVNTLKAKQFSSNDGWMLKSVREQTIIGKQVNESVEFGIECISKSSLGNCSCPANMKTMTYTSEGEVINSKAGDPIIVKNIYKIVHGLCLNKL